MSLFPPSPYKMPWLSYQALYLLCLLEYVAFMIYKTDFILSANIDTETYIRAADVLSIGSIDAFRTPVYPALIAAFRFIFGSEVWPYALSAAQIIVYIVSARYFYLLARSVSLDSTFTFWIIAFYLLWSDNVRYECLILTEGLAVPCYIFLAWFAMKCITGPSISVFLRVVLLTAFLIYLRPAFIYLLPLLIVYFAILFYRSTSFRARRNIAFGLIGIIIIGGSLAMYRSEMAEKYGIHTISTVTIYNNAHFYDVDKVVNDTTTMAESEKIINGFMREHPGKVAAVIGRRFFRDAFYESLLPSNAHGLCWLGPNIFFYWICIMIFSAMAIYSWIKTCMMPLKTLLLISLSASLALTVICGSYFDWGRLYLPAMPCFLILFAKLLSLFRLDRSRQFAA